MGIKCEKVLTESHVKVTGDPVDLMAFYFVWQLHVWPEFLDHEELGAADDNLTKQSLAVIAGAKSGAIFLENNAEPFVTAYEYAIDRCVKMGITIETVTTPTWAKDP